MSLTKYIKDLGRPVAYYPNLKKVTGSTPATILLCQLLYWSDKTKDGWIWKTSQEIEEETGLTYNEQRYAREVLKSIGLIQDEYKRLSHEIRFYVNQEVLNKSWEEVGGSPITEIPLFEQENIIQKKPLPKPEFSKKAVSLSDKEEEVKSNSEKRGDWIDGLLEIKGSKEALKATRMLEIKDLIYKKMHINASGTRWESFIDFAYQREEKHKESFVVFIKWALNNGFDPVYWTPEKMRTLYPQAFKEKEDIEEQWTFTTQKEVKEDYMPMPDDLKPRRDNL